jgi:hypothetical protein
MKPRISQHEAKAAAEYALEARDQRRANIFEAIDEALLPHGLEYGSNSAVTESADLLAEDIMHFARPIAERERERGAKR